MNEPMDIALEKDNKPTTFVGPAYQGMDIVFRFII